MFFEMKNPTEEQINRLCGITGEVSHEHTVECVIRGTSPGEIYADNPVPRSCFIKTPECNVLAGDNGDKEFLDGVRNHIDYYDPVTYASSQWEKILPTLHCNIGLRKYLRFAYKRKDPNPIPDLPKTNKAVGLIYANDLASLSYGNADMITDWINIIDPGSRPDVCLAAVVLEGNDVISCSALDCLLGDRVEIGIKTIPEYRGQGYGYLAAASLINRLCADGITEIGWHCVATNKGSRRIAEKCGFQKVFDYDFFCPFPPIENTSDLSADEWEQLALFFTEKSNIQNALLYQAERCRSQAEARRNISS